MSPQPPLKVESTIKCPLLYLYKISGWPTSSRIYGGAVGWFFFFFCDEDVDDGAAEPTDNASAIAK